MHSSEHDRSDVKGDFLPIFSKSDTEIEAVAKSNIVKLTFNCDGGWNEVESVTLSQKNTGISNNNMYKMTYRLL